MSARRAATLSAVVLAVLAPAGQAGPPKPVVKTFKVENTVPWPNGGQCEEAPHQKSTHVEKYRVPAAGVLQVAVTGFYGDMDIVLYSDKGVLLAEGKNESSVSGASPGKGDTIETLKYKPRAAQSVEIHVCNYLASPNADGKITFTPNR